MICDFHNSSFYNLQSKIFNILHAPCSLLHALSHPELRKEVVRLKNSGHPDQDEREANPEGFDLAIAEETEQRVGDKNEPSDRGEQNQYEKLGRATISHEVEIDQRTGSQYIRPTLRRWRMVHATTWNTASFDLTARCGMSTAKRMLLGTSRAK